MYIYRRRRAHSDVPGSVANHVDVNSSSHVPGSVPAADEGVSNVEMSADHAQEGVVVTGTAGNVNELYGDDLHIGDV